MSRKIAMAIALVVYSVGMTEIENNVTNNL